MDLLEPAGGKSWDLKTLHHNIIEVFFKFVDLGNMKIPLSLVMRIDFVFL